MTESRLRLTHGWHVLCFVLLLASVAAVNAQPAVSPSLDFDQFQLTGDNLSEATRQKLYLQLIENFVGWAEHSQRFVPSDELEQNGGYFDAAGSGVNWQRGNGNLCLSYALLLTEYPDKQSFSIYGIPRAQIETHFRQALKSVCISNKNSPLHKPSRWTWGGPSWQSSLPMIGIAWSAKLGEDYLDDPTTVMVRELVWRECDHLEKDIPSGIAGNTHAEDCAWNAPLLAFAANMYPTHPRAKNWDTRSKQWALNAMSIPGDQKSVELVDGRPLSSWMVSENVYPDLTIENHNMWSVGYQCTSQHFGEAALAYRFCGNPLPAALSFRAKQMWDNVTSWLYLWDGDLLFPHGQDWSWKTYSSIEYLCWLYCCQGNSTAGALESRALQMIYRRQLKIGTGDIGAAYSRKLDFGNQTVKPKRWTFCYLMHKYFAPSVAQSRPLTEILPNGVAIFPHTQTAIHRTKNKCVSVSWHPDRQPIYILPEGDSTFVDPPFFLPYDPELGVSVAKFTPKQRALGKTPTIVTPRETRKHPGRLLADGDSATYWVGSNGNSLPGDGPSDDQPIPILIEYPQSINCNHLVLQARPGYGPKSLVLHAETKQDGFQPVANIRVNDRDGLQAFQFESTTARRFRIDVKSAFDRGSPARPRNVQIREIELLLADSLPLPTNNTNATELLSAEITHRGNGMRVCYSKQCSVHLEQRTMVWSLPDRITVYATEFRANRDGQATVESLFPVRAVASPGFENSILPTYGRNWLELNHHMSFVSPTPIPEPGKSGVFQFSKGETIHATAGKPFGLSTLVVLSRPEPDATQEIADTIHLAENNSDPTLSFKRYGDEVSVPLHLFAR